MVAGCGSGDTVRLTGPGASFPAPVYQKWFKDFKSENSKVQIDYQSVGSGRGVKNFIDEKVDFAASDAALTPEEIGQVKKGAVLLPMTAGSIVLAYNIDGVDELKLSRDALKTTPYLIGYIEYGYAEQQKLNMASLENQSGKFVKPTIEAAQAALATAEFDDNLIAWVPDPAAPDAYPIVTFTWLLCYQKYDDPNIS